MPPIAMKLISSSTHAILRRVRSGSKSAEKKQEVAMQATPTDTLAVWMLS